MIEKCQIKREREEHKPVNQGEKNKGHKMNIAQTKKHSKIYFLRTFL